MPFLLILAYFLLETLAFWGVARLIGVGWAVVALFLTMMFGMSIALWEIRRLLGRQHPAQAGNIGLTFVGGLLLSAPGFVTTILGILLIAPPTRAIIRTILGMQFMRRVEKAGLRVYSSTSYGSFGGPVIDEDEIREWTDHVRPEDFGTPGDR